MKLFKCVAAVVLLVWCGVALAAAPSDAVLKVRAWRQTRERQIVSELMQLVALPNIASNRDDIAKNALLLTAMFEKRGFAVNRVATPGSPVLIAQRDTPRALGTLTFYFHYDGQPTEAKDWTMGQPFAPVAFTGTTRVDLMGSGDGADQAAGVDEGRQRRRPHQELLR